MWCHWPIFWLQHFYPSSFWDHGYKCQHSEKKKVMSQLSYKNSFTPQKVLRELSIQFSSVAQLCPTLWDPMNRSMPGLLVHHQLRSSPKPTCIELVMPSNHLCRPLLLLPSIFLNIRVFSNESALHIRWPKYWSFSFNISPSHEHSGLISLRIDWFDLLAVQGTLKSLL